MGLRDRAGGARRSRSSRPTLGSIADATGPKKPWIAARRPHPLRGLRRDVVRGAGRSLRRSAWRSPPSRSRPSRPRSRRVQQRHDAAPRAAGTPRTAVRDRMGLGYVGGLVSLVLALGLFWPASAETGKTMLGLTSLFGLDRPGTRATASWGRSRRSVVPALRRAAVPVHARPAAERTADSRTRSRRASPGCGAPC